MVLVFPMHTRHKKHTGNAARLTTAPVQIPAQTTTAAVRPEWIRLPKPGTQCFYTGLSRSKVWETLQTGRVRNVCLRKDGALRGARLIHLASLLAYLDGLTNEAENIGADDEAAVVVASAASKQAKKGGPP